MKRNRSFCLLQEDRDIPVKNSPPLPFSRVPPQGDINAAPPTVVNFHWLTGVRRSVLRAKLRSFPPFSHLKCRSHIRVPIAHVRTALEVGDGKCSAKSFFFSFFCQENKVDGMRRQSRCPTCKQVAATPLSDRDYPLRCTWPRLALQNRAIGIHVADISLGDETS